jgi:hypothetical protein
MPITGLRGEVLRWGAYLKVDPGSDLELNIPGLARPWVWTKSSKRVGSGITGGGGGGGSPDTQPPPPPLHPSHQGSIPVIMCVFARIFMTSWSGNTPENSQIMYYDNCLLIYLFN